MTTPKKESKLTTYDSLPKHILDKAKLVDIDPSKLNNIPIINGMLQFPDNFVDVNASDEDDSESDQEEIDLTVTRTNKPTLTIVDE